MFRPPAGARLGDEISDFHFCHGVALLLFNLYIGVINSPSSQQNQSKVPTFREAARMVHAEHLPSWKNPKHGKQWIATMERYVFPKLGDVQIDKITASMVREVLLDIWLTIPETARRVRQRIGTVLDYGYACDWRDQEAPMRSVSKPTSAGSFCPHRLPRIVPSKSRELRPLRGCNAAAYFRCPFSRSRSSSDSPDTTPASATSPHRSEIRGTRYRRRP